MMMHVSGTLKKLILKCRPINRSKVEAAEKVVVDNGIEEDEASTVLQAVGYALLDAELYS